jgi:glycosyltransferase involved in cell wall biosynthesis
MSRDPWLSVVVPWWSRAEFVRQTLESMARQTEQDFECLIVDQGQEDTLQVLDEYRGRFDFRVVVEPRHSDWMSKTNTGFRQARGRFVCMLHTDDVWHPDRIATLRFTHQEHPEAGLLFHAVRYVDSASHELGHWHAPLPADRLLSSSEVLEPLIVQNFISCPAPMLRRDLIGSGVDPTLWYTGDWDLYLRVASATQSVYLAEPLADFRLHTTSLTMQGSRSRADFRRQLDEILRRFGETVPARQLRIARFSNAVNVALADAFHGNVSGLFSLLPRALDLGTSVWGRYLNDSRILERSYARLRLTMR